MTKFTDAPETVDSSCASTISVKIKKSILYNGVRELIKERSLPVSNGVFTYTIAPGELAVFEVAL